MKFVVRRALFALITLPAVALAYALVYFGLGVVVDSGSVGAFASAVPSVAIGYTILVVMLPQVSKLIEKVVA